MKRILSSVVLAGGLLAIGAVNAGAQTYCSLDPTLKVGLPVHYNLNVTVNAGLISTNLYASGTSKTTTFGGGVGLL
jgi:hypothetical protein